MFVIFVVSVLTPDEAMNHYHHGLLAIKEGKTTKTAAYQNVGVDHKTTVDTAAITKLHAINKDKDDEPQTTMGKRETLHPM